MLTVALESLVRLGESIPIQHQTHHHLLAVRSLVSRVAALGLRIALALAFEVGRRQIVEVVRVVEVEEALLSLRQGALDTLSVRLETVQVAVQSGVAEVAQID